MKKKNIKFKFKKNIYAKNKILIKRLSKDYRYKPYLISSNFNKINLLRHNEIIKKKVSILIKPNNIFCTLEDLILKKTLLLYTSGKSKLHISKKTLRFNSKLLIKNFLILLKRYIKNDNLIVVISGPIKVRKFVLKQTTLALKLNKLIIDVKAKKCFNGCRPKKKRRKKQKGLRIFK